MASLTPKLKTLHAQARAAIAGDPAGAAVLLRQVLKKSPGHPEVLFDLAGALLRQGKLADAEKVLRELLRVAPGDPGTLLRLAMALREQGRYDAAMGAADEAVARGGGHQSLTIKAELHHMAGDWQAGYDLLAPEAAKATCPPSVLFEYGRLAARLGRSDEAIDALQRAAVHARTPASQQADALFELATLREAAGDYDLAWDDASRANALQPDRFDAEGHRDMIDRVIAAWTTETLESLPTAKVESGGRPLFIVGMPRSGTTLVEQILASHPQVHGGGELSAVFPLVTRLQKHDWKGPAYIDDLSVLRQAAVDRAAREYLKVLTRLDASADRVTDKQPFNFLYLGFIRRLFPDARIVHCTRHPLDTAVSCWFQSFGGTVWFANRLENIAVFYDGYRRLMDHWHAVLGGPMLDVAYEGLVDDTEAVTRRLLDFAGLPWDDRCLRFFETRRVVRTESIDQVRRPVYRSSVGRWKHYERHLGPLQTVSRFFAS